MDIATVNRWGVQATLGLLFVAIVVGLWIRPWGEWLAVPLVFIAVGAGDFVHIWLTRTWPRVAARSIAIQDQSKVLITTRDVRLASKYVQSIAYAYEGARVESHLVWSSYPPERMTVRVNPEKPTDAFCIERLRNDGYAFSVMGVVVPVALWVG